MVSNVADGNAAVLCLAGILWRHVLIPRTVNADSSNHAPNLSLERLTYYAPRNTLAT